MDTNANIAYEIIVEGHLDTQWSEWFDGLVITFPNPMTTRLCGTLADQSALFGVLKKVHHLGLTLVAVRRLDSHKGDRHE